MARDDRIKLDKEEIGDMKRAIQHFSRQQREEEIGELASGFLLDMIVKEIAPTFYNRGVEDACAYLGERLEDARSLMI